MLTKCQALSLKLLLSQPCGEGTLGYSGKGQKLGTLDTHFPTIRTSSAKRCPHVFCVCVVLKVQATLQRPGLEES